MIAYYDDAFRFKYDKILIPISDYKITKYPKNKNMLAIIRYFERNKIFNSVNIFVDKLNPSDIEILGTNITNNCQRPRQQNKMELHFNIFDKIKIPYIDVIKKEEKDNIIYRNIEETKLADNYYKELLYIIDKIIKFSRIIKTNHSEYLELTKDYLFDITFTSVTLDKCITIQIPNFLLNINYHFIKKWMFNKDKAEKIKGIEYKKIYHELMTQQQWKQLEEQENYKKQIEKDNIISIATKDNPKYLLINEFKPSVEVLDYNYTINRKDENYEYCL